MSDTKGINYNEWGFDKKTLGFKDKGMSTRYQNTAQENNDEHPAVVSSGTKPYKSLGGVYIGTTELNEGQMYSVTNNSSTERQGTRVSSGVQNSWSKGNNNTSASNYNAYKLSRGGSSGAVALNPAHESELNSEEDEGEQAAAILSATASKPRLSRGEKVFCLSIITLCLMIAISLSILMSRGLNIGHVMGKLSRVEAEETSYYMVVTHNVADKAAADSAAEEIVLRGGAGFVYHKGTYHVVAAIYPEMTAAQTVAQRMEGYSATVVKLDIPRVKASFVDKELAAAVSEVLKLFGHGYNKLYEMAIKLDTGEMSQADGLAALNGLIEYSTTAIDSYKAKTSTNSTDILIIRLNAALQSYNNELRAVGLGSQDGAELSRSVKYSAAKIIADYAALCAELNAAA